MGQQLLSTLIEYSNLCSAGYWCIMATHQVRPEGGFTTQTHTHTRINASVEVARGKGREGGKSAGLSHWFAAWHLTFECSKENTQRTSILIYWKFQGVSHCKIPSFPRTLFHTTVRCVGMCICGVCVCVCVLMLMCVKSMQISLTNKKNRGKNTPIEWPSVLVCLTRVGGKDGGQAAGLLPILRHPAVPERHRYDSFPRRIYEYKCSIEKPRASFILSYNMNMAFPYHPSSPFLPPTTLLGQQFRVLFASGRLNGQRQQQQPEWR